MSDELTECVADTLADAESAQGSVAALMELLAGCPPGHQLTVAYFATLIEMVQCRLDNVVDGLRVVEAHAVPG